MSETPEGNSRSDFDDEAPGNDGSNAAAAPSEIGSFESGRITGIFLLFGAIGTVASILLGRFALGLSEDSGAVSFAAYRRHPLPISVTYEGGMIAGVLLILAAPLLYKGFAGTRSPWLRVAATCQALAGSMLAMSASRWLIVIPYLAKQYHDVHSSATTRAAINVDYETISYFVGITLGEHLFAILIGTSTLIWGMSLRSLRGKRWLVWLGIAAGFGWLLGSIEQLDFSEAQYFAVFLAAGPITWLVWSAALARELTPGTQGATSPRATS